MMLPDVIDILSESYVQQTDPKITFTKLDRSLRSFRYKPFARKLRKLYRCPPIWKPSFPEQRNVDLERPFKCDKCESRYTTAYSLKRHISDKRHHSGMSSFFALPY